jgi:hypothetical protein
MKEEMDSLENKQTWDLVQLPVGKRALQNKWVLQFEGRRWRRKVVQG